MGITLPEFLALLRSAHAPAHAQDHLADGISRPPSLP